MQILSVGEVLWDVFGQTEFLGGAPLNFSASAQKLGNAVSLLTAVGDDERGSRAMTGMRDLGLTTDLVQKTTARSTGTASVTTDANGSASFVIERPAAFDCVDLNASTLSEISQLQPAWIYFGTLAQSLKDGEQRLQHLLSAIPQARCFYDVNLRKGHWNLALVQRLSALASIIKLNDAESMTLFELTQPGETFSLEAFCAYWSSTYGTQMLCITLGDKGCAVWHEGNLHRFPGFAVTVVDTVGAGDAFAAAFLHGHGSHWAIERTAIFANALGAIVASRAGATPSWTIAECLTMINSVSE